MIRAGLIAGFVSLLVTALSLRFTLNHQASEKLLSFKAEAYTSYVKALSRNRPVLTPEVIEARTQIHEAKYLAVLYGSPAVVASLIAFEVDALGGTDDQLRATTCGIAQAMRADLGVREPLSDESIWKILFTTALVK